MTPDVPGGLSPLASLRRFARPRPARERCELCSAELPDEHAHLVELASRQLRCACEACAILFSNPAPLTLPSPPAGGEGDQESLSPPAGEGHQESLSPPGGEGRVRGPKFRRVPRDAWLLTDFRLTDVQWEGLGLPVNLAFFLHSTPAGRVVALYPSPAGATEALPAAEVWQELADENPVLHKLEPDVEALLVNRLGPVAEYYRVGIDQCYKLVGLVRTHWRGLSGGPTVQEEMRRFFAHLKKRAHPTGGPAHA